MKPHEEAWTWHQDDPVVPCNERVQGHSGAVCFPKGRMAICFDPANYTRREGQARGRLAAHAPAMARLLLERVDNSDSGRDDAHFYCGWCGRGGSHRDDCRLIAVLKAAGVVE